MSSAEGRTTLPAVLEDIANHHAAIRHLCRKLFRHGLISAAQPGSFMAEAAD